MAVLKAGPQQEFQKYFQMLQRHWTKCTIDYLKVTPLSKQYVYRYEACNKSISVTS
jgi:hypothetical protein